MTAVAVYASAAVIVGASVLIGAALCGPAAERDRWNLPAAGVGFATVMTVSWLAVRLPGHGATAAVVLALLSLASLLRVRSRLSARALAAALPAVAFSTAMVSLPYAAVRRVGSLGTSFNDDLAVHVYGAQVLAEHGRENLPYLLEVDYPLGPHSLVAAVSQLLGVSAEPAFAGLLLAVPVLTAIVALGALPGVSLRLRTVVAVLVGCCYLPMAFLAQASFKEPIEALLALATIPVAIELGRPEGRHGPALGMLAVITLACGIDFSVLGAAWPLAIAACVVGASPVGRRYLPGARLALAAGAGVGAVVAIVLVGKYTDLGDHTLLHYAFHGARSPGGNLLRALSPLEGFGVWPTDDFRLEPPPGTELWRAAVAFAVVATALGIGAWWRWGRREVLAAAAPVVALYFVSAQVSADYVTAKALVVAAPLVTLVGVGGLMLAEPRERGLVPRLAWTAVAGLLVVLAASSSAMPLRAALVRGGSHSQTSELAALRPAVGDKRVMYLGADNWAGWELRFAPVASFATNLTTTTLVGIFQSIRNPSGDLLDRTLSRELAGADYVIAPRSEFATSPPPSLRLVRQTRWYRLWRRSGPVAPRRDVGDVPVPAARRVPGHTDPAGAAAPGPSGEGPGALLDCSLPAVRRAAARGGRALVRLAPVIATSSVAQPDGTSLIAPARGLVQTLELPPGRWELSMRYVSVKPLSVVAGPLRTLMPEHLSDPNAYWRVGEVRSTGAPLQTIITTATPRFPLLARDSQVGPVAAVRTDRPPRLVPIRRACGRYADWYETGGPPVKPR